jgi:hypothetical protein
MKKWLAKKFKKGDHSSKNAENKEDVEGNDESSLVSLSLESVSPRKHSSDENLEGSAEEIKQSVQPSAVKRKKFNDENSSESEEVDDGTMKEKKTRRDSGSVDPYNLNRFAIEQIDCFDQAVREINTGRKRGCWMW